MAHRPDFKVKLPKRSTPCSMAASMKATLAESRAWEDIVSFLFLGAIVDRIQEVIIFIPMTEALVSGTDGGSCHERRVEADITEWFDN